MPSCDFLLRPERVWFQSAFTALCLSVCLISIACAIAVHNNWTVVCQNLCPILCHGSNQCPAVLSAVLSSAQRLRTARAVHHNFGLCSLVQPSSPKEPSAASFEIRSQRDKGKYWQKFVSYRDKTIDLQETYFVSSACDWLGRFPPCFFTLWPRKNIDSTTWIVEKWRT